MPLIFLSPIHKASRQIALHLEDHCVALGVSTMEGHVLSYLRKYPSSIATIKRVFGSKPSTLTSLLDRLAARGLITRKSNPDDRRSFLVATTAKGDKIAETLQLTIDELELAIRAQLKPGELEGFDAVMQAIAKATGVTL